MKLYQNTNPEIVDSNRLTNKMTNNSIWGGALYLLLIDIASLGSFNVRNLLPFYRL